MTDKPPPYSGEPDPGHHSHVYPEISAPPSYSTGGQPYPPGHAYPPAQPYQPGHAYPPPQPYPPGQYPPVATVTSGPTTTTTTVYLTGPGVVCAGFGPYPARTVCPHCRHEVMTTVEYITGGFAWLMFGILFGLGFLVLVTWCVCCIPFCIDSCKDARHTCPQCNNCLGTYRRM